MVTFKKTLWKVCREPERFAAGGCLWLRLQLPACCPDTPSATGPLGSVLTAAESHPHPVFSEIQQENHGNCLPTLLPMKAKVGTHCQCLRRWSDDLPPPNSILERRVWHHDCGTSIISKDSSWGWRCNSVGRAFAWCTQSLGFHPVPHKPNAGAHACDPCTSKV